MLVDVVRGTVEPLNRRDLDAYAAAFPEDAERSVPGVAEMVPNEMAAQLAGGWAAT